MEEAINKFWSHHLCHRQDECAVYCGLCDGESAPEGSSWRETPHEQDCAFLLAKQATGED